MMVHGGNEQLREYFDKLQVEKSSVDKVYQTRASAHYRETLREKVCFLMLDDGLMGSPKVARKHSNGDDRNSLDSSNKETKTITVMFSEGPLGMTLSALPGNGHAYVSKVSPQGSADKGGVAVGDTIVSIAGRPISNYEDTIDSIPFIQRPMIIEFSRMMDSSKAAQGDCMSREVSWDPLFRSDCELSQLTSQLSVSDEISSNNVVNNFEQKGDGTTLLDDKEKSDESPCLPPTTVTLDFSLASSPPPAGGDFGDVHR